MESNRRLSRKSILMLALIPCFILACNNSQEKDAEKTLREKSRAFSEAYMEKDFDYIVNTYTYDGVVMSPGKDLIIGHEKLSEYWTEPDHSIISLHRIYPVEIKILGDHAYDYGYYEIGGIYDGEKWGPSKGTYLIVWKQMKGEWKIHLDMFHGYEGEIPDSLIQEYNRNRSN